MLRSLRSSFAVNPGVGPELSAVMICEVLLAYQHSLHRRRSVAQAVGCREPTIDFLSDLCGFSPRSLRFKLLTYTEKTAPTSCGRSTSTSGGSSARVCGAKP